VARLGVGGLLALIAASILAGCSQPAKSDNLTPSPSPSSSAAQAPFAYPWIPYPGKQPASGPMPTPLVATVACTLAALQVTSSSGGAYHGDVVTSINFSNTSSTACYMAGTPAAIQLTLSSGVAESVALGQAVTQPTVTLGPGQENAILLFGSSALCAVSEIPPAPATSAIITLPNGDAWTITASIYVRCGTPSVVVPLSASAGPPATPEPATATSPAVVAGVPSPAS